MTTTSTFLAMVMLPLNTLFYVHLVYGSDTGGQVPPSPRNRHCAY
jgi:hypothetical protein